MAILLFSISTHAQQWSGNNNTIDDISRVGNVGIGTAATDSRLTVNGDIDLKDSTKSYKIGGIPILRIGANIPGYRDPSLFIGRMAGYNTKIGPMSNVFIGDLAGYNNTSGSSNTFIGALVGLNNTTGNDNIFIGYGVASKEGSSINTGSSNTFVGVHSGYAISGGSNNNFFGSAAGFATTTGNLNTFVGTAAGRSNTTGSQNSFFGYYAGVNNLGGSNNTFIGTFAKGTENLDRATAIGYNAYVSASDAVVLGASEAKVGIGVSAPEKKLHVKGDIYSETGGYFINNFKNLLFSSQTGRFGSAVSFDFNRNTTSGGILIESGESESGGFYADGDYAAIWSPGDQGRLLRVYDEDGMVEKWYLDANGNAFTVSDGRKKENIQEIDNAMDKVMKLRGVSYYYKMDIDETVKAEKKKQERCIGFIAQELEEVIPQAVQTDEKGNKFVNYTSLIPVLVQSLKEQQQFLKEKDESIQDQQKQIEELKNQIDGLRTEIEAINKDVNPWNKKAELYQNSPNPFSESTKIAYILPDNAKEAYIYIYNLNGEQLKEFNLTNQKEAFIEIKAKEIKAGMYIYSLIVDGKEIDSKKMILSEKK